MLTGPLLRKMPSELMARALSAGKLAGTTVTLHPYEARRLRMLCLQPKSYATTCRHHTSTLG